MDNIISMQRKKKSCAEKLSYWFNEKFAPKPKQEKKRGATRVAPRNPEPPKSA